MRPTLPPRLLGHLREMLAEKEEDLQASRLKLQASEDLQGQALSRLEGLEAHFGVTINGHVKVSPAKKSLTARLDALEQLAMDCRLLGETGAETEMIRRDWSRVLGETGGVCDGSETDLWRRVASLESAAENWSVTYAGHDLAQQLLASHRLVEQLREQLHSSDSGHAQQQLLREVNRWRGDAEAIREQAEAWRQEAIASDQKATSSSREVEALRGRLADSLREASILRNQLATREADVAHLEKHVADLKASCSPTRRSPGKAEFVGMASFGSVGFGSSRCEVAPIHPSVASVVLDETRQVGSSRQSNVPEDLVGQTVTIQAGSAQLVTRHVSPTGVRRQVTAPAISPIAAASQGSPATAAWPESPEDSSFNKTDLNRDTIASRQDLAHAIRSGVVQETDVLSQHRVTVLRPSREPATSSTMPAARTPPASFVSPAPPLGSRTPPALTRTPPSSAAELIAFHGRAVSRASSPSGLQPAVLGGAQQIGLSERATMSEHCIAVGTMYTEEGSRMRRTSAPSQSSSDLSRATMQKHQLVQSASLDGLPVGGGNRSQSVPVAHRHANGSHVATAQVSTACPNGVSLARWASTGSHSNAGARLASQLHPGQASPFLGQVLRR